jgi:phosphate transport system permease protein
MNPIYAKRRRRNNMFLGLSVIATLFGLGWLAMILGTLLYEGFSGLDLAIFTQSTPPPGLQGGLLNAIVGSLIMTSLAVLAGTPIGILVGTYLAEYGRYTRLAFVVRFVNDILLSAPSIVIGLFIYELIVVNMGHFSAWAGAAALTVIVIPVVVRTRTCLFLFQIHCAKRPQPLAQRGPTSFGRSRGVLRVPGSSPGYCLQSRASPARRPRFSSPR